jgi:hypothetical protein
MDVKGFNEMKYRSLESKIRDIFEANHIAMGAIESDQNDQIAVGSYTTKAFEVSPQAQKLYADLPKDTNADDAQTAAENLDKLFDIVKDVHHTGKATAAHIARATMHGEIVMRHAAGMKLEKEHEAIVKAAMDSLHRVAGEHKKELNPDDDYHPADDKRFHNPPKGYTPDPIPGPQGDKDIDNLKRYLIKRSRAAERKIKIIDAD